MGRSETPFTTSDVINVNTRPEQSVLIGHAADRIGLTRSDFMLEAACREAEEIVLDQVFFPLNDRESTQFVAMLDHPPATCAGLLDLVKSKSPWE